MTDTELAIVTYCCLAFGWAFLLADSPRIALGFLFAAFGGFVWDGLRKKWGMK